MGTLNDILNDVGAEARRMGTLGAAELANALFGNGAFTQYGAGQTPVRPHREPEQEAEQQKEKGKEIEEQNRGLGMGM